METTHRVSKKKTPNGFFTMYDYKHPDEENIAECDFESFINEVEDELSEGTYEYLKRMEIRILEDGEMQGRDVWLEHRLD